MKSSFFIALHLLIQYTIQVVQQDQVLGLNNITGYDKPWYSGYLDISTPGQSIKNHYFFFPSQSNNSSSDPLLLWLNGGPGCSSLLGAVQEHGPFVFKTNSTEFESNPYSWNLNANVIYLETPPGTGFSTTTDTEWNDEKTAQANVRSILKFLELYPEYKNNKFYISGESYAGILVPTFAQAIIDYNEKQGQKIINLQGIMVGNGCTHPYECLQSNALVFGMNTLDGQGWFDIEQQDQILELCGSTFEPNITKIQSPQCQNLWQQIWKNTTTNLNTYNILTKCYTYDDSIPKSYGQMDFIMNEAINNNQQFDIPGKKQLQNQRRVLYQNQSRTGLLPNCADVYGPQVFFNNKEVKKAIHVPVDINWSTCIYEVFMQYQRGTTGTFHLYPGFVEKGLDILIYSGDVDAMVSIDGTLYWLDLITKQQNYQDIVGWRSWYAEGIQYGFQKGNRQNAGQYWKTEGITFVSFKGCGHMVPQDNRPGAYDMVQAFFNGYDLPEL